MHDQALTIVAKYHLGPVFTPPALEQRQWSAGQSDSGHRERRDQLARRLVRSSDSHRVRICLQRLLTPIGVIPTPNEDLGYGLRNGYRWTGAPDRPWTRRERGCRFAHARKNASTGRRRWRRRRLHSLSVQGLPLIKPPYGTISAISLDDGEILWQGAHGDTPDAVRNNPALKGMTIPRTGQMAYNVGTLVTKTLVIAGDGQVTTTDQHPRGAMLRAYNKSVGKEVGAVWMPAPQSGSPMTYMLNGKQYIIVAISGGNYSGEYVAYTLPSE